MAVPQLWNREVSLFSRDNVKETKGKFANICHAQASFLLRTLDHKRNVPLTYVEVQAALFRLFVLGCIHLLSSWSWSAILFVADPLPASTRQTHEGETLTRRMRRKPAHLGMTKAFKEFSVSQIPPFFVIQPIVQTSSTWKKIFYIFGSMCYLCFSGPWGSWSPRKMKWELAAAARRRAV